MTSLSCGFVERSRLNLIPSREKDDVKKSMINETDQSDYLYASEQTPDVIILKNSRPLFEL